jgi:chemotaxis protein methyltransferase CheR
LTDVFRPFPDKRGLYRPSGARATSAPAITAIPKIAAMAGH